MTKLEEKLEHLEFSNMDDEGKPLSPKFTKVLSALRKALEQRDDYMGVVYVENNYTDIRENDDLEILKVLGD